MMNSRENYLDEIAQKILPANTMFSEQQKEVILDKRTINVVAGPGTGKTTVLAAKFALLMQENKDDNFGICLITHTNVAVEEIKKDLGKLSFVDLNYPHFIGTIQEFFNTFFSKKAFHLILGEKKFKVLDDDEYREKFDHYFDRFKPSWYDYNNPNVFKQNVSLNIAVNGKYIIESEAKAAYKSALNTSVKILFEQGYVTNKQCLELSRFYIVNNLNLLRDAISNRFNFILLDETQDTDVMQYELLELLFGENNVSFQRYGDPRQALYNIFDDEDDSWVPSQELHQIPEITISETVRFGESIARIVSNLGAVYYEDFVSFGNMNSFNPHFIVYDNQYDLIRNYKSLINKLELEHKDFALSNQKDAIVSVKHDDLSEVFQEYSKPIKIKTSNKSQFAQTYSFLLSLIAKKIDEGIIEIKEKIEDSLESRQFMSIAVKELLKGDDFELVKNKLEFIIEKLYQVSEEFTELSLNEKLEEFRLIILNNDTNTYETNNHNIGTIHSVKGETHRSTMLLLNSKFTKYNNGGIQIEYTMLELLKTYLVGRHIELDSIDSSYKKQQTYNALKLAYVALSRATHLIVIAIPESLAEESFLEELQKNDWIEYKQDA